MADRHWHRYSAGAGAKGHRVYVWAWARIDLDRAGGLRAQGQRGRVRVRGDLRPEWMAAQPAVELHGPLQAERAPERLPEPHELARVVRVERVIGGWFAVLICQRFPVAMAPLALVFLGHAVSALAGLHARADLAGPVLTACTLAGIAGALAYGARAWKGTPLAHAMLLATGIALAAAVPALASSALEVRSTARVPAEYGSGG